jgi:uncharacterized protein DUF6519
MKGDFSRFDFNPADNFTGVLYQQGRVLLDTDGNAETQIEGHLRATLARDAIGANVAAVPMGAPDSLKLIQAQATASEVTVMLKPGRIWADGVPVLLPASADVSLKATYLGPPIESPEPLPSTIANGIRDAVILEVWEEAFSGFQNPPALIEPALGGPDTTERVKAALALRLLRLGPGDDCGNLDLDDDFANKGKLTVTPAPSITITGDCPVDAGGGYSGFEHYLYRIEIASPDGGGAARFKWSQWNGGLVGRGAFTSTGVATGTVAIKANNQMINQCGVTSFYLEALKLDTDLGHWTVVFTADATLPQDDELSLTNISGTWPAVAPATAFFRLWNGIELIGDFPIPGGGGQPNELKDGVRLAFEAEAAGKYTPGDYWTFPVRAAGAGVDAAWIAANWPSNAPPQGIHYHRVPLGILEWDAAPPVTVLASAHEIHDCRLVFPPLTKLKGCCTYTVGDGMTSFGQFDTIQAAIDALSPSGGEICILPGNYVENLSINGKDNVTLKGCDDRSKITSPAPGGEFGTAAPVLTITDAEHIRVESLQLVAHATGVGILVAKTPASRDIALENLLITAATRSAIEVQAGRFITIHNCRVLMNDVASPWPGVFVTADDVSIEENLIHVQREAGFASLTAAASAGRGGLQLGGTSDRVRVINNLIAAGIGNGITLGTLEQVNAGGVVIDTPGWVVNAFDPCDPCAPGDVYVPPSSGGGDDAVTIRSAGALRDILIERNRIFNMGLNGIGVVAFFNLAAADEFISVNGLRILGNEIRGCLSRSLANIPADMIDAMGYGGIALADVEDLVVDDNAIEDNGPNHLEPICGIFVLHGEGIDITHNRILNNGKKTQQPSHLGKDGRRGGINVVLAVAPTVPTPIGGALYPNQNGVPAAKIHENIVSQPLGQALSLAALGPVSVLDNHFTSRGMVLKLNPLSPSFLAATVAILNLGVSNEIYSQLTTFSGVLSGGSSWTTGYELADDGVAAPQEDLDDKRAGLYLANGNVLFADNRCDLNLLETGLGFALSSIAIISMDDVGFHDNQCDCNLLDDFVVVNAAVIAASVRMSDNRFKEGVMNAALSAATIGIMNATTDNQSTHCLFVQGAKDTAHSPPLWTLETNTGNRVLLTAAVPNLCNRLLGGITTGGYKYMTGGQG